MIQLQRFCLKCGIDLTAFVTLQQSLNVNDVLYEILLALLIVIINGVLYPLCTLLIDKIKEKIANSKNFTDEQKENIYDFIDESKEVVKEHVNEELEKLKDKEKGSR